MINFDYNLLYPSAAPFNPSRSGKAAPRPPWATNLKEPPQSELLKAVLNSRKLIDLEAQNKRLGKESGDFPELFALYNGLNSLDILAKRADAKGVSSIEIKQLERRFAAGLKELGPFIDTLDLDKLQLIRGEVAERARTGAGVRRDTPEYRTGVVHRGDRDAAVEAWSGEVKFQVTVSPTTGSTTPPKVVSFDLAEMGTATRTVGAVVNYMNGKLEAAGVYTRFEREKLVEPPRTMKVGDKTVTLPAGPDGWTLKVKGAFSEALNFTAPASADAVYLVQNAGKAVDGQPETQERQLLKFQSDPATNPPPPAVNTFGQANWVEGRVFSAGMDPDIAAVRASATGADGAVYMVAELVGEVAGQTVEGRRDAALLKYDSTGQLLWSRTLGAEEAANATAIAVGADGRVAIGGSVTGELQDAGATASLNAAEADSFVTVFDSEGSELWTRRGGSHGADEVRALSFGADGSVIAAGRTVGAMPDGGGSVGGSDGWVRAWDKDGKQSWTRQFGTAGSDAASALAVEGSALVVAGVEDGRAVIRRFDLAAAGGPAETARRDLGDLAGGAVTAVALQNGRLTVAGSTRSGGLDAPATNAFNGGRDAFVAALDGGLTASTTDRVSYWGGAGEDEVTAVTLRNGQAWIAGSTNGEIADTVKQGAKDGFVARLDAETGAVGWARRWTAKDGEAAPSAIAVGAAGASVLDRLGLPTGTIDYTGAQEIAASTSARAGDRFYLRVNGGRKIAVTLEAGDTLKTLGERVNRALGFNARAETVRGTAPPSVDGTIPPGVFEKLEIATRNDRTMVELLPGEGGRDLLGALGLMEGRVRRVVRDKAGKEVIPEGGKTYGLKLAHDLTLSSKAEIKRTADELNTAKIAIQTAYRDLADAMKPKAPPTATGPAPAWMQKQAANYQAALNRLTGGG
ncbi:MAG: transcriptional regulator [Proteobacteria bacterium]|nr:transcriptional regulator [Pseudomonadota bacterium]